VLDLFELSLEAHKAYVAPRIANEINRHAYTSVIDNILCDPKSLLELEETIRLNRTVIEGTPECWYEFFTDEKKYQLMAVDQAQEILDNMTAKFITGFTKSYPY
jgi:hypothetical protein